MTDLIAKLQSVQPARWAAGRPWSPAPRRTAVCAVDLDGSWLLVAQGVRRGERAEITRLAAEPLAKALRPWEDDPQTNGHALALALQRLQIKSGPLVMGIPRNLVMLRTLSVPAADTIEELASMVHFQIGKDLPFRVEEAVIDFQVLRRLPSPRLAEDPKTESRPASTPAEGGTVEVLAAVLKHEVVERYQQTAAAAGCKLVALGLGSYANARCVTQCNSQDGAQTIALVSLRTDEFLMDVVSDRSLTFSRMASLALPGEPAVATADASRATAEAAGRESGPAPAEPDLADLVAVEAVRTLHSYEASAPDRPVQKILVTGGTGMESQVVEALAEQVQLPCQSFDPASALGLPASPQAQSSATLSAVGLVLGGLDPEGLPFDFLNPKRPPVERNWRRLAAIAIAAALALLFLVSWAIRTSMLHRRAKVRDELLAEVNKAEKDRPLFRDIGVKSRTVREWLGDRWNWLDHYAVLSALLPSAPQLYITSLSTGARGVIHLAVQATSGEVLAAMDRRLRDVGYRLKPLAITPSGDRYGYRFQTSVELGLTNQLKVDKALLPLPTRPDDDSSLDPPGSRRKSAAGPATAPAAAVASAPTGAAIPISTPAAPVWASPVVVVEVPPAPTEPTDQKGRRGRGLRSGGAGGNPSLVRTNRVGGRGKKAPQS